MKKRGVIFLFVLFLCLSRSYAQSATEVIYIRIQEDVGSTRCKSLMTIAYPNDKTEEITLVEIGLEGREAKFNTITVRNKLNQLTNDGYTIESTSVGASEAMTVTIIVLVRKQQPK